MRAFFNRKANPTKLEPSSDGRSKFGHKGGNQSWPPKGTKSSNSPALARALTITGFRCPRVDVERDLPLRHNRAVPRLLKFAPRCRRQGRVAVSANPRVPPSIRRDCRPLVQFVWIGALPAASVTCTGRVTC